MKRIQQTALEVVGRGRMKFNKTELAQLASQPSHKFDKEGVLFVRERKQEGFFKRNEGDRSGGTSLICVGPAGKVSVERWCRLRGNLLFYFKSRDQWSEPAGLIVLENVQVQEDNTGLDGTFGLVVMLRGGPVQHLSTYTRAERDSWRDAIESASHGKMKQVLQRLRERVSQMTDSQTDNREDEPTLETVIDPSCPPLLECSFSCDNLLCDALGRSPSARLLVYIRNSTNGEWRMYSNTEIVERTSNPSFLLTVTFRSQHNISRETQVRVSVQDMRERFTMTKTTLGSAVVTLDQLLSSGRVRLKLLSPGEARGAGFVTVTAWTVEREESSSSRSTPSHQPSTAPRHRRSHSLPPSIQHRVLIPSQPHLLLLHTSPNIKTYRFHSGLGGDISVMEVMLEPKIAFSFPQQLLTLWISEERELVHEIAGLGELREPWHSSQMSWLENHLNLINTYTTALENLNNYRGANFKRSAWKGDQTYEFVPTNLHLQRIWVQNESLRKSGFYDLQTVGAFSAYARKTKSQGLMRMLKELKSPQKDSSAWCSLSDKLQMAEDCLTAVRKVRREVVDCMRLLMRLAKDMKSDGMMGIVEEMLKKTKLLCSISDTTVVEESLSFLEENRVTIRPERDEFSDSVAEFLQRNKLKIDLQFRPLVTNSLQTPCSEFVCSELMTPESGSYSVFTSGYQSVDRLTDIDEWEENFKVMSVEDKTRHYYTLFRDISPSCSAEASPVREQEVLRSEPDNIPVLQEEEILVAEVTGVEEPVNNEGIVLNVKMEAESNKNPPQTDRRSEEQSNKTDLGIVSDNEASPHYNLGDEPEPLDLTHLNIEAAMMCLASKVRALGGKTDSPTFSNRTFRFKELETLKRTKKESEVNKVEERNLGDFQTPAVKKENTEDWAEEVRPSMRKLRQGMDSLLKTTRMMCSVLRLQQLEDAVRLTAEVKHRRDVCFSQALTSLVSALMSRLWCHPPCPVFLSVLTQIGPLVCFEGLLSMHGEDVTIYNDMIVAIEDLRSVEFTLILVETKKSDKRSSETVESVSSFPLPRVTGARANMKVLLPVPNWAFTVLPLQDIKTVAFTITPVFFNVGINEQATLAEKLGLNGPQEKNNSDNFRILMDYVRRYKKMNLFTATRKENNTRQLSTGNDEALIEDLLSILKNEVSNKKNKNVDILSLSSQICLKLNGLRVTSCKSGKDRTGMSATLEQVNILSREFDLADNEYQRALDTMRSEGTRRRNCLKNIELDKYAFSSTQLSTFPRVYRPPVGTYGSKQT